MGGSVAENDTVLPMRADVADHLLVFGLTLKTLRRKKVGTRRSLQGTGRTPRTVVFKRKHSIPRRHEISPSGMVLVCLSARFPDFRWYSCSRGNWI